MRTPVTPLGGEGDAQNTHCLDQALRGPVQRDFHRGRVDVVRALPHVDVIERMQKLVLGAIAAMFQSPIGDDLVRVLAGVDEASLRVEA